MAVAGFPDPANTGSVAAREKGDTDLFTRCLFCHRPFPANETVERFPVARRVAFDPWRGRLWAVCDACGRWSLAPIEERWEALEDLDRIATDRGRQLASTDNIALIRAGDVDLVRVGRARIAEEAWWRYGRELQKRHRTARTAGWIEMVGWLAVIGSGFGFFMFASNEDGVINAARRWYRFGSNAWVGEQTCRRCGEPMTRLPFKKAKHLIVTPDEAVDGLALELRCTRCGTRREDAGYRLDGAVGQHVLRRVLAYRHFSGASEKQVREATARIDAVGSSERLARAISERRVPLREIDHKKNRIESFALEIALNDEVERGLLELELKALEARWRQEEELAAIIDGELTPIPLLDRLRPRGVRT